jgi:hypothetical protein
MKLLLFGTVASSVPTVASAKNILQAELRIQIRINLSCWIRMQKGKNDPQIKNCWMFPFEG